MNFLLKLISLLPLSVIHRLGGFFGILAYRLGTRYREKMHDNLRQAGLNAEELAPRVARQLGMQALETAWVWKRPEADIISRVEMRDGDVEKIRSVLKAGRSIVFMTPHIGCFEIAPVMAYDKALKDFGKTMTILYREPKIPFLKSIVAGGRVRPGMDPAPANLAGVRKIVRAMRAGGILGCLPDQVPGRGEGVWVPFFGRLAFTMSFPTKMAKQFDSVRFIAWTDRIPGKGWKLFVKEWDEPLTGDEHHDCAAMNRAIEEAIFEVPEQYTWSYNRYKPPAGAPMPTEQELAQVQQK